MFSIICTKGDERLICSTECLIHRQPALHGFFSGLAEGALQQFHLFATQRLLETLPLFSQFQQAFALVGFGGNAVHQVHFLQLAQRHVQRLLAHTE